MADDTPKVEELSQIEHRPPLFEGWMDKPTAVKPGIYCYGAKGKNLEYVDMPNARDWSPVDEDWKLPENWEEIFREGFKDRLDRFRSFKLFMDICVRCGACADKCHFFIGSGDPKNMTVMKGRDAQVGLP